MAAVYWVCTYLGRNKKVVTQVSQGVQTDHNRKEVTFTVPEVATKDDAKEAESKSIGDEPKASE